MAAQVITFKNNGAVGLLLGVFIFLQNIHIITSILPLVSDPLVLSSMLIFGGGWNYSSECMLVLVVVGFTVPNVCWF